MHQFAVLSTGCLAFFHSAPDGFITVDFFLLLTTVLFFVLLGRFSWT
jgi:hypothetical protein